MAPRPTICSVQAALSATTKLTTTSSSAPAALISRSFSSTPSSFAGLPPVPPESPNYIKLPNPPQSSEDRLPRIRGILPVPREVFSTKEVSPRQKARRIDPDYVSTIKPKSAREQAGLEPLNSHDARHRVLAESRRRSLSEGLQGLYQRKKIQEGKTRASAAERARVNIAAAMRPERLDEVLTRSTVRASSALNQPLELDPQRFEAAEKIREAHAAKMAGKSEERMDAISHLYMEASNFIVDEAELEERIEAAFKESMAGASDDAESIWVGHGLPARTKMEVKGIFQSVADPRRSDLNRTVMRQKVLAETLTGGKL